MSRTKRKNSCWYTKEEYRKWLENRGRHTYKEIKKSLAKYGTDTDNWDSKGTTALKKHSNSWRRAWERDQLSKSYKDWENEFDPSVDKLIKELWWVYF